MITTSRRITATVAGALISAGILAGGAVTATRTTNLADYGAAITADNATDTARSEGVPHMSVNRRGDGAYFERMDGDRSE